MCFLYSTVNQFTFNLLHCLKLIDKFLAKEHTKSFSIKIVINKNCHNKKSKASSDLKYQKFQDTKD